ncbi:MAG: DNA repair protein RecO [Mangrovibacterium sp.]
MRYRIFQKLKQHHPKPTAVVESTRGIFLHYVPYTDSSVVATIYTEKFGRQTYLVNGIRNRKSGFRLSLMQALFLLELEVYHKPGRDLQRVKEFRLSVPFSRIPFEILRSSQALLIAEVLMKCLKEEEPNPDLFRFLFHAVELLDLKEEGTANFLLLFLFKLTRYLGVCPQPPGKGGYFDLMSATFRNQEPGHHAFLDAEMSRKFSLLYRADWSDMEQLNLKNRDRSLLIEKMLDYYRIHAGLDGQLRSLAVLKNVLS